jgi:hypothetical protein
MVKSVPKLKEYTSCNRIYYTKGLISLKIKIVNSIYDKNRNGIPFEMIGKEYDVVRTDENGVWVQSNKLEVLVLFEELDILNLDSKTSVLNKNFLKHITKDKYIEYLEKIDCIHLL